MTKLTADQHAILGRAAQAGLPYALWRPPEAETFTLLVSTSAPYQAPVFAEATPAAFVMAAFDAADGNLAWHLPADLLVTASGCRFRAEAGYVDDPASAAQAALLDGAAPGPVQAAGSDLHPPEPTPRPLYEARVAQAVAAIRAGQAEKIVLSRVEPRALAPDHDLRNLVQALAAARAQAFVSLVSLPQAGTWLTATPEVLLRSDASGVFTMALAGTQWPDPQVDPATLSWPRKIIDEQAIVASEIRSAFAQAGLTGVSETPAHTVRAAQLCHLRSDFAAPPATPEQLARLLRLLHPTSAVCGMPRSAARAFITEVEGAARGFYPGYLGPVGIDGETRLLVNLRAARITRSHAFLHVGGGIVAASDPALEYQETVEKARTIGEVLTAA